MKRCILLAALALEACSAVVPQSKGILLDVDLGTPLEQRDLLKHCDLGDQAACSLAGKAERETPLQFSIVQGIAPSNRAVFAALIPKEAALQWFAYDREAARLWKVATARPIRRGNSAWALQRIDVRGLEPERDYELLAGDAAGHLLEDRIFRTLASDEKQPRIALVGGLARLPRDRASAIIRDALGSHPAFLLYLSGNVAAPFPTALLKEKNRDALDFFFQRHAEARASLAWSGERRLTPIAALWNEDEFGQKKGDRTFAFRDQAREALELFFPFWADEQTIVNGPGLSKTLLLGDYQLALLDDRSFRVPAQHKEECHWDKKRGIDVCVMKTTGGTDDEHDAFGSLQTSWLAQRILRAARPTWIATGAPWFGPYNANGVVTSPASFEPLVRGGTRTVLLGREIPAEK